MEALRRQTTRLVTIWQKYRPKYHLNIVRSALSPRDGDSPSKAESVEGDDDSTEHVGDGQGDDDQVVSLADRRQLVTFLPSDPSQAVSRPPCQFETNYFPDNRHHSA